jgi:predicted restriction endonuclease
MNNWSREQLLLALNLYCKLPFGQYHQHNDDVIYLARAIDRSPSAVAMKLANFASLDAYHQARGIKGLGNIGKADKEIWDEFTSDWNQLPIESEALFEATMPEETNVESEIGHKSTTSLEFWGEATHQPTETVRSVKVRLGQKFFRKTVLANYSSACCICGMPIPSLLIASHIVPWHEDGDLRLNPHNGLCLCAIHDKGFDEGIIAIGVNFQVLLSPIINEYLPNDSVMRNFEFYRDKVISMPHKFLPQREFLEIHQQKYFIHSR